MEMISEKRRLKNKLMNDSFFGLLNDNLPTGVCVYRNRCIVCFFAPYLPLKKRDLFLFMTCTSEIENVFNPSSYSIYFNS